MVLMGIINKINLNELQADIRELVSTSLDIRLMQEQFEDVINYIEVNEDYFKNGKISKEIHEENKEKLEKNKKLLISKIDSTIASCVQVAKKAQNLVKVNKI